MEKLENIYDIDEVVYQKVYNNVKCVLNFFNKEIVDIYQNPHGTFSIDFGYGELEIGVDTMSYFIVSDTIKYVNNRPITKIEIEKI